MAQTAEAPTEGGKGKGRKKSSPPLDLKVADKLYLEQFDVVRARHTTLRAAVQALAEQRGELGAAIKLAISLGKHRAMTPKQIRKAMEIMDSDLKQVDRDTTNVNWMLKAAGVPIGAQLGLFEEDDETRTIADASEREKVALTGGAPSFKLGMQLVDNPYPDGTAEYHQWAKEWGEAAEASMTKH